MSVFAKKAYKSKLYSDSDSLSAQLHYMSPFDKNGNPPVLPTSMGNFVTTDNMSRMTVSTDTSNPKAILFCPSVRGTINALIYDLVSGVVQSGSHDLSTLIKFATGEHPTVSRTVRSGLKINCTSSQTGRSGVVRCLQFSSPIELEYVSTVSLNLTTNCADEIYKMARTHPKSRSYTAEDLTTKENTLVMGPATASSYQSWGTELFKVSTTDAMTQDLFLNSQKDMPMNNCIIVFESTSAAVEYEVRLQTQDLLRFPVYTLLGTLARPGTIAKDKERLERTHQQVSAAGGILIDTDAPPPTGSSSSSATITKGVVARPKPKNKPGAVKKKATTVSRR